MRMLLSWMNPRPVEDRPLYDDLDAAQAQAVQADLRTATRELGSRHERLGGALDEIMRVTEHLTHLERRVCELREPLDQELSAHRQEHGELIITRALLDQTNRRLAQTRERERHFGDRVESLEFSNEEGRIALHGRKQQVEEMAMQIDKLTAELTEARTRGGAMAAELRDTHARLKQLEEDIVVLRKQALEDETFRREVDALLARGSQESLVLEEENATLRRRADHAVAEAMRLSNLEIELQAQLVKERDRLAPAQAAVERAQAELLQLKATFEEQLLASRSEALSLTTRLETATARANRLEALNADSARRLSEATAKHRADDRRLSEMAVAATRSEERIATLEEELNGQRHANAALERARLAALERSDQLGKTLKSHELTIRRAEERLRDMQVKLEASASAQGGMRLAHEQASSAAASEVERLRAELAIAQAGLESAHEERARSHRAVLNGGPTAIEAQPVARSATN